jgi:glycolate oxidase
MDRTTIGAVDEYSHMDLDRGAAALLFAQTGIDTKDAVKSQLALMADACGRCNPLLIETTDDPDLGSLLMPARKLAYPALERIGRALLDDVSVPRQQVTDMMTAVERISDQYSTTIATFGHAGDGNLHPTIIASSHPTAEELNRAQSAFAAVINAAIELGGVSTGEHGVGLLKLPFQSQELHPRAIHIQRRIKDVFDPSGLLNPGKSIG